MDSSHLARQFRILGTIRAVAVNRYIDALSQVDEENVDHQLSRFFCFAEGAISIGTSVGLVIKRSEILPRPFDEGEDLIELVPMLMRNLFSDDHLRIRIGNDFGSIYASEFALAQLFAVTRLFKNFDVLNPKSVAPARRALVKWQVTLAHAFLDEVGQIVDHRLVTNLYDPPLAQACLLLSEYLRQPLRSLKRFPELDRLTETVVNGLVPHFASIDEALNRSSEIQLRLERCPLGRKGWKTYEEICIQSLRQLFVPPFRKVMVQPVARRGFQRRDAVLPNNQFSGFWKLIKEEFNSRHIVCEFKNLAGLADKEDLLQLRTYLSKRTIGKFGLLFTRKGVDKGFLEAQRNAYEEAGILILVITDAVLTNLLRARAFNGSADFVLEDLKAQFELGY